MIKIYRDRIWFVYVINSVPIGVVALDTVKEEIVCLLVDSKYRRKGIGTKLIKALEKEAHKIGIEHLHATTNLNNTATVNLFKKCKYKKVFKLCR